MAVAVAVDQTFVRMRKRDGAAISREILGVDVAKGQNELQREREQREPPTKPSLCPNPTHRHQLAVRPPAEPLNRNIITLSTAAQCGQ